MENKHDPRQPEISEGAGQIHNLTNKMKHKTLEQEQYFFDDKTIEKMLQSDDQIKEKDAALILLAATASLFPDLRNHKGKGVLITKKTHTPEITAYNIVICTQTDTRYN